MFRRTVLTVFLFALAVVFSADAAIIALYNDDGYQYSGTGTKERSQHFSPTEAVNPVTQDFDAVQIGIDTRSSGSALVGTMSLYNWVTDYSTTVAPANLVASTPVNIALGQEATVTLDGFGLLPATGQYLMYLSAGIDSGTNWGLRGDLNPNGSDSANNDAYNGSDLKTDREYQVSLNAVPEPGALALLAIAVLPAVRRRLRR